MAVPEDRLVTRDRRHRWGPWVDDHAGGKVSYCRACEKFVHVEAVELALQRHYEAGVAALLSQPSAFRRFH